jgi:hypothetical protein
VVTALVPGGEAVSYTAPTSNTIMAAPVDPTPADILKLVEYTPIPACPDIKLSLHTDIAGKEASLL